MDIQVDEFFVERDIMIKKLRLFATITIMTFILCSCKKSISPSEITIDNKIISYSDNKETVESIFGRGIETELYFSDAYDYDNKIQFIYNEEDQIRAIKVIDESAVTFKNIKVGDDVTKLREEHKYEVKHNNLYFVLYDGQTEVDSYDENTEKEDHMIYINYFIDDNDKIEAITIIDGYFNEVLK